MSAAGARGTWRLRAERSRWSRSVAFIAGGSNTELRAQTFAYVLFALTLLLLLGDDRAPSRRVYLTLPLLVLWANVHGSVLLGAGLVALYGAISASERRAAAAGAATLAAAGGRVDGRARGSASLASPYGFELPGYYRRVLGNSALRRCRRPNGRGARSATSLCSSFSWSCR